MEDERLADSTLVPRVSSLDAFGRLSFIYLISALE